MVFIERRDTMSQHLKEPSKHSTTHIFLDLSWNISKSGQPEVRHDEISPKLYGVETHLKRSKIDSFSFVHCFVLQRRRCWNIYKVIDNHCPGHAPHHQARLLAKSEDWEHVWCLSVELLEWLDREAPRAWHSDRCVMFIPDTWLSLQETRPAWLL